MTLPFLDYGEIKSQNKLLKDKLEKMEKPYHWDLIRDVYFLRNRYFLDFWCHQNEYPEHNHELPYLKLTLDDYSKKVIINTVLYHIKNLSEILNKMKEIDELKSELKKEWSHSIKNTIELEKAVRLKLSDEILSFIKCKNSDEIYKNLSEIYKISVIYSNGSKYYGSPVNSITEPSFWEDSVKYGYDKIPLIIIINGNIKIFSSNIYFCSKREDLIIDWGK